MHQDGLFSSHCQAVNGVLLFLLFPTFESFFLLFGKCPTFDLKFLLFPTFETFFLLFFKYSLKPYKNIAQGPRYDQNFAATRHLLLKPYNSTKTSFILDATLWPYTCLIVGILVYWIPVICILWHWLHRNYPFLLPLALHMTDTNFLKSGCWDIGPPGAGSLHCQGVDFLTVFSESADCRCILSATRHLAIGYSDRAQSAEYQSFLILKIGP